MRLGFDADGAGLGVEDNLGSLHNSNQQARRVGGVGSDHAVGSDPGCLQPREQRSCPALLANSELGESDCVLAGGISNSVRRSVGADRVVEQVGRTNIVAVESISRAVQQLTELGNRLTGENFAADSKLKAHRVCVGNTILE